MSAAFERIPRPDWASTTTVAVADTERCTAEQWAEAIFDVSALPSLIRGLFALRAVAAAALRIPQGDPTMLAVDGVVGNEAIIDTADRHLRFVVAVRTEPPSLVHVVTAVTFKGLRGRVYFAPVRLLHDAVTRSMMESAARRVGA